MPHARFDTDVICVGKLPFQEWIDRTAERQIFLFTGAEHHDRVGGEACGGEVGHGVLDGAVAAETTYRCTEASGSP